jgi:hypothetical protein
MCTGGLTCKSPKVPKQIGTIHRQEGQVAQDPQLLSESLWSRREWNCRRPEVGTGR